tara:strand:+ start:1539 stop:2981 length:1443 start_codon:yes stop_codon:yes gene_type:complete
MDESSPVFQNFQNKMSAMSGRPKMNVTNMKTIFGDGRGRAAISGKGSALVRGGLDNKLFQVGGTANLGERIAANERKITLLKNVLKAQKPFGGKEDEIIKINSTLQSIGNIITTDYANRINESKLENKLLKNQLDAERKSAAERGLEKVNKIGSSVGSGISSIASKVTSPITGIFDKLLSAATLLGAGIVGNAAVKWWTKLTPQQQSRVVTGLKIAAVSAGVLGLGFLGKKAYDITRFGLKVGGGAINLGKNIVKSGSKKIRRFIDPNRAEKLKRLKNINKIKANKLNNKKLLNVNKITKTGQFSGGIKTGIDLGKKTTTKGLSKTAVKTGAKFGVKKGLRVAAGSAPILGFLVDGGFAVERLLKGDKKSAGIYMTSALASFIPKAGTVASVGLTVAGMQSAAEFDAKKRADKLKEEGNIEVIYQEINNTNRKGKDDQTNQEKVLSAAEGTQVFPVSSINLDNPYMIKTPEILGIILGDN